MVLSLVLAIVGLLICLIPSKTVVVVGVFLYGAGLDISYSCVFTLVTEFFAEKDRGFFYNIIALSFAAGILINPVFFYLIDSWKLIVLTVFVLPISAAALGFIIYVEDTPI
jgi:MFS family permease